MFVSSEIRGMCSMEAYMAVNYPPKNERDYQEEIREPQTKDYHEAVTANLHGNLR